MSGTPNSNPARLAAFLRAEAGRLGFHQIGIARPDAIPQARERLEAFLKEGRHGSMSWMAQTAPRRADPKVLWPEVRSIIMLGFNYGPEGDPLENLEATDCATISVYARNRDYHDVIKGKLKELAGRFAVRAGADVKVFVDTAPVMEKPLAGAAGLGWQGKHTNLVSRSAGSWLFLGAIFTTADLPEDAAETDHCGRCRACLDICPTNAFPEPYQLDTRACISYLTIENKGPVPQQYRKAIGNRIYGCDDCLAVCPWNKFAQVASEIKLRARADLESPALLDLLALDDAAFRNFFSGSPIKRIGRDRFIRNVLIAAGNSGNPALIAIVVSLLRDPSPLVRGAAIWALGELDRHEFTGQKTLLLPQEDNEDVRREWLTTSKKEEMT